MIDAGGRQQTVESQQTMTLARTGSAGSSAKSAEEREERSCETRAGRILLSPVRWRDRASAQDPYNLTSPVKNLATLFTDLYGPRGADRRQPGDAARRAAAHGAFQQRLPVELQPVQHGARQPAGHRAAAVAGVAASPTSSIPALGVFQRTTQSFGPILAERAETVGARRVSFGFASQRFTFDTRRRPRSEQGAGGLHARQRATARRP